MINNKGGNYHQHSTQFNYYYEDNHYKNNYHHDHYDDHHLYGGHQAYSGYYDYNNLSQWGKQYKELRIFHIIIYSNDHRIKNKSVKKYPI